MAQDFQKDDEAQEGQHKAQNLNGNVPSRSDHLKLLLTIMNGSTQAVPSAEPPDCCLAPFLLAAPASNQTPLPQRFEFPSQP